MYSFVAIKGVFGALDTFLIMVPPGEIPEVVGHDPRGMYDKKVFSLPKKTLELYENVQRAVLKEKVKDLEQYTARYSHADANGVGALPALSVGLKTAPKFKRFDKIDSNDDDTEVGTLKLHHSAKDNALYLDGLKRACAILNKSEDNALGSITVAIMLFAPREGRTLTDVDLAQLFFDFNSKATPIPKTIAVSRDSRDPYISLANALAEMPVISDNGGVDKKHGSLGKKSTNIVILPDLITFVRGATEGVRAVERQKEPVANPILTDETRVGFMESIPAFLGGIVEGMTRDTFRDRVNHVHLSGAVWGAWGVIFNDLYVKLGRRGPELLAYARRIGQLDWGRSAERLHDLLSDKVNKSTGKVSRVWSRGGGHNLRRPLVDLLRKELGIAAEIDVRQPAVRDAPVAAMIAACQ
jgi:DndB-like DNA-sulfur modification-associated protein